MNQTLYDSIKRDVKSFMDSLTGFFFSEAEFQLCLAQYLRDRDSGRKIHLEYYVPGKYAALESNKRVYIDIVVEKDATFVPIELKYKTRKLATGLTCFGGIPDHNGKEMERNLISHGAKPYNRYLVWKDVKRLESVKASFPDSIPGGLVVFLTNESDYWEKPGSGEASYSILGGSGKKPKRALYDKPDIMIKETYDISWDDTKIKAVGSQFCYCIINV